MAVKNVALAGESKKDFANPENVSVPGYGTSEIDMTKSANGGAVSGTFVAPVSDASKSAEQLKAESDFNAKQAAFDAQNAAGTKIENLDKVQTQSEIDAQRAKQTANLATSAPQPVATTTETSQKPVTAQAEKKSFQVAAAPQVNYDTATGREQEVIDNLSKFYQQGATDYESLKKMAGYATADQGKKDVIDAFYQSKQPRTEDQFFSVLSSGNRVFNAQSRQTPEYQSASRRVESLNKYRNFSSSQFSSALKSGSLIPGTQAYRDLQNDPNASANLAKAVTLNAINGVGVDENSVKSSVMGEIYSSPFGKAVSDGYIDPQEADAMMTTDEIRSKQAQIEPLKNKYDALKASYDAVETEVDNELKGTGATDSYKNALVAARRKDIYKDLQVATDAYNNAVGTLADLKKAQSDVLSMNLGLYKDAQAFAKQKELAQFQSDLALQQSAKEFEQKMAQNAKLATDPVSATQQLLADYKKIGISAQRSDVEIIQDVQNKVAQGMTVGQAISELNQAFQSKPEYARYKEVQAGQLSDREKMQYQTQIENAQIAQQQSFDWKKMLAGAQIDMQKLASQYDFQSSKDRENAYMDLVKNGVDSDSAMAAIRTYTGDWKGATGAQLLQATDGTIIPSRLSRTTNPNGGKECAEYVNDVIGNRAFGDSFYSKMAQCDVRTGSVGELKQTDKSIPSSVGVGSVAVWQPGNSKAWQKYGHVGIITADNGDSWTIKSSNLHGHGEISSVTVPKGDIWGYKTNAVKTGTQEETLSPKMREAVLKRKTAFEGSDQAKDWKSAQGVAQWLQLQGNKPLSGSEVQGLISNYAKILDPTSVVRESEYAMAQAGAGQGFIDKKTQEIKTFLEGGSQALSADAQKTLKEAISRRIEAMRNAYLTEARGEVETANASGIPLKLEQLVPSAYLTGTQASQSVANPNDVDAIMNAYYNR